MDRTRWKEIDAVLEQALELEPGDRANALSRICAGDEELRRRVEALLGEESAAEHFLEASAFGYLALQLADGAIGLTPGQQIGRFQIEQLIGEGGWARSIWPRIRYWVERSRSNCCRRTSVPAPSA